MLIANKKAFSIGILLTVAFLGILWYMFTDSFGGKNAFHASDALFNSISKGSTYYIPQVREGAGKFAGQPFEAEVLGKKPEFADDAALLLRTNGFPVETTAGGLKVSGDLGELFDIVIRDSDAMFRNDGAAVESRYGMAPRRALFVWWMLLNSLKQELDHQKKFAPGAFIGEMLVTRAVEVGYNYYGIEGRAASAEAGVISFSLLFYVAYTIWWGFAIFFLFEGLGLEMKAGKKKEM